MVGTGESMVEFERRVVENNIVRVSDGLWNLTIVGKLFGKKFKDWYRTEHAKQYVEAVKASEPRRDVLIVGTVSREPTWGHYKIASDMLYQTNVHYSLWITDMACRYVCREPVKAAASFQQAAELAVSSQNDRVGFLYVGSDKDGRCKVGKSKDVARREQKLRCGNIDYRTVYTVGPNVHYDRAETAAHALLESHGVKRLHGEWFECAPNVAYQACKDALLLLLNEGGNDA